MPCWHKRNLVSFYKLWGKQTQKYIPLFIFICKIIVHCRIKAVTSPLLTFFILLQQVRYQPSINNNKINICLTWADSFVISFCTYISIKFSLKSYNYSKLQDFEKERNKYSFFQYRLRFMYKGQKCICVWKKNIDA